MNKKQHIVVLRGGHPSEHEVSLKSGQTLIDSLSDTYEITDIVIQKDLHHWQWNGTQTRMLQTGESLNMLTQMNTVVVIGLHGPFGEDGTVQTLLETWDIPFTGSNALASTLCFDKYATEALLQKHGVTTTKSDIVTSVTLNSLPDERFKNAFMKPRKSGSSVDSGPIDTKRDALELLDKSSFTEFLIQKRLLGKEFTCGVIDIGNGPEALPVTEAISKNNFFDYDLIKNRQSTEITPANIDQQTYDRIQHLAVNAHNSMGCTGITRTDFILADDTLHVLEINTLPGMTETSFVPQQLASANIELSHVLTNMIESKA